MSDDPRVRIRLGGDDAIRIATTYETRISVFEQPNSFSLTIGDGESASSIIKRVPYGTPFQLLVDDRPQFSGYTTGYGSTDESGTEVAIQGKGVLSAFVNNDTDKEESFNATTHLALVQGFLDKVNLVRPFSSARPSVLSSNTENRLTISGENTEAQDDDTEAELLETAGTKGNAYRVLRTKIGERTMDLVRRHLDAAGLFMWESADGNVIVGRPNPRQVPAYRIVRMRGQKPNASNVTRASHRIDVSNRYSEVIVYGKASGKRFSRTQVKGGFRDDELYDAGIRQTYVMRDHNVTCVEHAEHLARKFLAKGRRDSFTLEYTLRGHTAPSLITGKPIVWAPDTMVDVIDQEYNLTGSFWIDTVTHRCGSGGTSTTIRLIQADTLIFGETPKGMTNASGKVTQADRDKAAQDALSRRDALYVAHSKTQPFGFQAEGSHFGNDDVKVFLNTDGSVNTDAFKIPE